MKKGEALEYLRQTARAAEPSIGLIPNPRLLHEAIAALESEKPLAEGYIPLYHLREYKTYGHMTVYSTPGKQPSVILPTLAVTITERKP